MLADGMRILVVGLGVSGEATVRYCLEAIASDDAMTLTLTAVDSGDNETLRARAERLRAEGVRVVLGISDVDGSFDLAIMSPGVPPAAPLFQAAHRRASRMVSEIEFAYRCSTAPWVAVTGTNGKTTVTSLIGHLLSAGGVPAHVVGNIGTPAIAAVAETGQAGVLVAEVSSFQLALTEEFHPRVAVLLNITADHLDWHGDFETYARDKAKVFANMGPDDTAVIDVDDSGSAVFADSLEARGIRIVRVSRGTVPPAGIGLDVEGFLVASTTHGLVQLIHRGDLRLQGGHNINNACAAAAAALACGVRADTISTSLAEFRPLEHRLEPVGVVAGVEYFNDSKATNPDAAIKAFQSFGDREVIVLLGGRNKGSAFDALAAAALASGVRAVVFGEAGDEIAAALEATGVEYERAESLTDAIPAAATVATPGGAVLLSPACASFDQFTSYAERGRFFRAAVSSMSAQAV